MTWNKRYDQYALSCGLRHSAERLQRWILWRSKQGQVCEIEIDLRVFNKYIERDRGRAYDRKTIKEALRQLDEKTQGLILITKSYTWAIHKVIVRPLAMVLQQNSQIGDKSPKLPTGNPMFSDDHKQRLMQQQQQSISKIDGLLKGVGLTYDPDALNRIWRLANKSIAGVLSAIELMLYRHNSKPIGRPHGFIIDCLTYGWHKAYSAIETVKLPSFNNETAIRNFVVDLYQRNQCLCEPNARSEPLNFE